MTRRLAIVVALSSVSVASVAWAYVLPAAALYSLYQEKRETFRAKNQVIEGRLIITDAGGSRRILAAKRTMLFNGRCRLEVEEAADESLAGAYAAVDRGRVKAPEPESLAILATMESLACPLLSIKESGASEMRAAVDRFGVNADYTGLSRLDGKVAFVIGGHPWEQDLPQIWLDKDKFLPVRLRTRKKEQLTDVRFLNYGNPITGEWHPGAIELWVDDVLRARFVAERLEQNVKLETGLFR